MNRKEYRQLRVIIALFVGAVVSLAVGQNSFLLAIAGVITGMVFMALVRTKAGITTDERETTIQDKAARLTYAIFAPTLGLSALLMLLPSYSGWAVFAKGEFAYLEALGMVFSYLSLFLISVYAVAYHWYNRQLGGGSDE